MLTTVCSIICKLVIIYLFLLHLQETRIWFLDTVQKKSELKLESLEDESKSRIKSSVKLESIF